MYRLDLCDSGCGQLCRWLLQLFNVSDIDHYLSCICKIVYGSLKSDRCYYSKTMNEIRITIFWSWYIPHKTEYCSPGLKCVTLTLPWLYNRVMTTSNGVIHNVTTIPPTILDVNVLSKGLLENIWNIIKNKFGSWFWEHHEWIVGTKQTTLMCLQSIPEIPNAGSLKRETEEHQFLSQTFFLGTKWTSFYLQTLWINTYLNSNKDLHIYAGLKLVVTKWNEIFSGWQLHQAV